MCFPNLVPKQKNIILHQIKKTVLSEISYCHVLYDKQKIKLLKQNPAVIRTDGFKTFFPFKTKSIINRKQHPNSNITLFIYLHPYLTNCNFPLQLAKMTILTTEIHKTLLQTSSKQRLVTIIALGVIQFLMIILRNTILIIRKLFFIFLFIADTA